MIRVEEAVCRNLELARRREWLDANGIGGFASSTIAGMNTRRYHGLLVAATHPPVGRMVLLSKVEETLTIEGRRYDLSCNSYPGVTHPQGHLLLKEFRQDPFPTFVYAVDGCELEKSVFMVNGSNTTVIRYEFRGAAHRGCTLEVRPLIAFRDYHSTTHENGALDPSLHVEPGRVICLPYRGCPDLCLAYGEGELRREGVWYRNFEYAVEQERGLDWREDLFQPLVLTFDLARNPRPSLVASTERRNAEEAGSMHAAELARRSAVVAAVPDGEPLAQLLVRAADQFVVRRGEDRTVIAGYHWFSDWGRDTMIALPGLTLVTGRYEAARGMLMAFAGSVDRGMLPNRFPDAGDTPEYNTVDATLWYFEAVRALAAYTGDYEFIRTKLYPVLADIVSWHERGTRYGIRMDNDGLLSAGEPGVQLTWMDAKIGDWVVTPRHGKPVEIQALWYNALRIMADLAERFGDAAGAARYAKMADRARNSFRDLFWNDISGCLYDVVNGEQLDGRIRPNQILAVSLFHPLVTGDRARSIVAVVEQQLLTPFGLRSLAPSDPEYRGRFEGGPASRDSAYHQGTVWPWLMGPFLTAYLKVNRRSAKARRQALQWLAGLQRYAEQEGLGQIPEVFDGDAPHRPGGCLAQAWSVAEILRALVEDIGVAASPAATQTATA